MDEGVDLDVAARGAAWACFLNMGQVCTSAERFYVVDKVFDEFVDRFVAFTKTLRIGDPTGSGRGPRADDQRGPAREGREEGRGGGARRARRVVVGGRRPGALRQGLLLRAHRARGRDRPTWPLLREETFGPVAPLVRCRDIDEAIALADRSEYGLGASIYTNSLEHAMKAMEAIHAGTFWINDPLTDNDAGPFGGMRRSGIGRELGSEGIEDFRDSKHVHLDYVIGAKPLLVPLPLRPPRSPVRPLIRSVQPALGQRGRNSAAGTHALRRPHAPLGDGAVQDHAGHDGRREAGVARDRGERRLPLRRGGEVAAQGHRPAPDRAPRPPPPGVAVVHEGGRRRQPCGSSREARRAAPPRAGPGRGSARPRSMSSLMRSMTTGS